jgi:hypothetical protein
MRSARDVCGTCDALDERIDSELGTRADVDREGFEIIAIADQYQACLAWPAVLEIADRDCGAKRFEDQPAGVDALGEPRRPRNRGSMRRWTARGGAAPRRAPLEVHGASAKAARARRGTPHHRGRSYERTRPRRRLGTASLWSARGDGGTAGYDPRGPRGSSRRVRSAPRILRPRTRTCTRMDGSRRCTSINF